MTIQIHLWDMIRGDFGNVRRLGITLTYGAFTDSSWGWHCGVDYLTTKKERQWNGPTLFGWQLRCKVL